MERLRIGVVESNPVEGFWLKMGFERIGQSKPFAGRNRKSSVHVMEKRLQRPVSPK